MDGVYVIFILMVYHLSFFLYFFILEELYLMLHIFIMQILGFLGLNLNTWFSGIIIYFFLMGTALWVMFYL